MYNHEFYETRLDIGQCPRVSISRRFASEHMTSKSLMRHYEVMAIFNPKMAHKVDELMLPYENLVKRHDGEITRSENWGSRGLAYPIDKMTQGCYALLNFSTSDRTLVDELEQNLASSELVIRYLLSRTKNAVTNPSTVVAEEETARAEKKNEVSPTQ